MNNVIPWEYLKLRIAINERKRTIGTAYAEIRSGRLVKAQTFAACRQSDAMMNAAIAAFMNHER